jgi:Mn-dependent DtxR family transcriptional regulator
MIEDGITLTEIAHALNIKKSHVSYYLKRAKQMGYVKECCRDKIKILQLTQPGKKLTVTFWRIGIQSKQKGLIYS